MTGGTEERSTTARFVTTHSILTLNSHHEYTKKSILDAQEMHRTVMSGFRGWVENGAPDARKLMGVLSTWTLDLRDGSLVLVVQSSVPPDWSRIPSAAWKSDPVILPVDQTIRVGETYAFRTVVNPTRERNIPKAIPLPPGEKRRHRLPHSTPKWAESWFRDRLQPPGEPPTSPTGIRRIGATADPNTLSVRMLPALSTTRRHPGLRLTRAEIKGHLMVTDATRLVDVLTHGLGRGRAYSTGLVLVRTAA